MKSILFGRDFCVSVDAILGFEVERDLDEMRLVCKRSGGSDVILVRTSVFSSKKEAEKFGITEAAWSEVAARLGCQLWLVAMSYLVYESTGESGVVDVEQYSEALKKVTVAAMAEVEGLGIWGEDSVDCNAKRVALDELYKRYSEEVCRVVADL